MYWHVRAQPSAGRETGACSLRQHLWLGRKAVSLPVAKYCPDVVPPSLGRLCCFLAHLQELHFKGQSLQFKKQQVKYYMR